MDVEASQAGLEKVRAALQAKMEAKVPAANELQPKLKPKTKARPKFKEEQPETSEKDTPEPASTYAGGRAGISLGCPVPLCFSKSSLRPREEGSRA